MGRIYRLDDHVRVQQQWHVVVVELRFFTACRQLIICILRHYPMTESRICKVWYGTVITYIVTTMM